MSNETTSETAIAKKDEFVRKSDVVKMVKYAISETSQQLEKVSGRRTPNNLHEWGDMIVAGELFPYGDKSKTPAVLKARAGIRIVAGDSYGLNEVESQSLFHIVDGRIVPDYKLRLWQIKRSKVYDLTLVESTDKICKIRVFKNGTALTPDIIWTIEDAGKAELLKKDNWKKYPKLMLRARASHEAFNLHCGDLSIAQEISFGDPDDDAVAINDDGAVRQLVATAEPEPDPFDLPEKNPADPMADEVSDGVNPNEDADPEISPLKSFLELASVKFDKDGELDVAEYEKFLNGREPAELNEKALAKITADLRAI